MVSLDIDERLEQEISNLNVAGDVVGIMQKDSAIS